MVTSASSDRQGTVLPDTNPTVPDHPSYFYAKTGLLVEPVPVPQAHLDRNQWMEHLAPDVLPDVLPFTDSRTGLTWNEDKPLGELLYHDSNECIRAPTDAQRVEDLRADPDYREAFQALGGNSGLAVDRILPSAQACYDPSTGQLVASGSYVGTWDFADPDIAGQSYAHWVMDMAPDHRADNYTPAPLAVPPAAPDVRTTPFEHTLSPLETAPSSNSDAGSGSGSGSTSSSAGSSDSGSSE